MPQLKTYTDKPVVLLTNDDGPPCASSPNIYAFCKLLQSRLGWDVRVVIPDSQKSWVGKSYAISDIVTANYFYPLEPDGLKGEITQTRRPLKEGESMEWVLLSGTPATCANIALHNLYPGQIDLVISGPNHGRNSSTAFALSSGTLGAALAASLSVPVPGPLTSPSLHENHMPCIAISYGVVTRPVPDRILELASETAVDVCQQLFDNWGEDKEVGGKGLVPIYSINIPLVEAALEKNERKIVSTEMWRNAYGRLFKTTKLSKASYDPGDDPVQIVHGNMTSQDKPNTVQASASLPSHPHTSKTSTAGPAALPTPAPPSPIVPKETKEEDQQLKFHFAPNMHPLLFPPEGSVPEGTDAWAFAKGWISVTPMRAEYACLGATSME
ncbi:5'/3'-nucleotidase SurE [Cryptococcus neoformans C23]|uniref:5'/3'-nucleotidase SurE n=1 Tax=Cryptococcus neoformans (strain H99 / ATCC 208821 / CBS 10515 / FGSC 9487) TaxID=235443 RepID=J9VE23_CRYN9|nr:5'/3'-nucleotidase SurE [Cryptococcus neoformans var. grubii H99]AUB21693.1 5'/3'-nucleotidase SurE [Cryptococcus neoformans var. grubii]OWZ36868.1 5'/3'-nucleotidase SurE [Cryptococcus neoformans var. grubii AD2-60a]OWZ48699.1 5'/3'-nucleotidase SurE [Cryptococcus neoformans var. grubii C23]OWZ58632.1 5'/3'-nucleotidase SurE [Cryptococcus neoformans var. grubii 125.91]OXC87414.1 5'/3'-nucleotidase SurE [Cryptococcus neoformans var. grubii AD1-7a]OXG24609.1 5'/3'-nucleotidase SurE [Cryptoc|eukprot:XP_012046563.1 5'/3'-nucleotidase SurE [Cryptococcus neoformans var. grubii H99]